MYLKYIHYKQPEDIDNYPFNLNILKGFESLELEKPVVIFVGENGTGKTTLLEGIASSMNAISICGNTINNKEYYNGMDNLGNAFKLVWSEKTRKGFILKSEDFLSYTKKIYDMKRELYTEIRNIENNYNDRSDKAKELAKEPFINSIYEIEKRYGEGLDKKSHGESFLKFFQSRFIPEGMYILDEPESPLSPTKQLALISMINDMVDKKGQFIIATHSPILMAIPNAQIVLFTDKGLKEVEYKDLEHVNITKDFLNDPDSYLRYL